MLVASWATACSTANEREPSPEASASEAAEQRFAGCLTLAEDIAATLQRYVDGFAPDDDGAISTAGPSVESLAEDVEQFQRRRALLACEARELTVLLETAMADFEGEGPMARAVAASLRQQVLATTGPAATAIVRPGDDLAAAVHGVGAGGLVRLEPGEHRLDEALVLLRDTRLVGAGADRTTITSAAPGAAVVQLGGSLELTGVSLEHTGPEPASVLVLSGPEATLEDVAVRGGVADPAGTVGFGLAVGAPPGETAADVVAHRFVADGNEAGGVAHLGRSAVLSDVAVIDNGGCGLCYLAGGGGSVDGGRLERNLTGVSATEDATASLTDLTIAANRSAGVLVEGDAAVELGGVLVSANGPVGVAVTGTATLRLSDGVVTAHTDVGTLAEQTGHLVLRDVLVRTTTVGVFVRGEATAEVTTTRIDDVSEAHAVFAEDATGTIAAQCAAEPFGVVLLDRADVETDAGECVVTDQRE